MIGEIRTELSLLSTAEGGRQTGIASGYHGMLGMRPEDPVSGNDVVVTIEGKEVCEPGEACQASLRFLSPELVQDVLSVNAEFTLREGLRVIGSVRVIELGRDPGN
jgi:translation elongation factor EF-Tu-like GTPase